MYFYFAELTSTINTHGRKVIVFLSLSALFNLVAVLFITIATSIGFVTLVNALSSVQPFFVLIITIILSKFYPKIIKEAIDKKTIFMKFFAILLMIIGAVLVAG